MGEASAAWSHPAPALQADNVSKHSETELETCAADVSLFVQLEKGAELVTALEGVVYVAGSTRVPPAYMASHLCMCAPHIYVLKLPADS